MNRIKRRTRVKMQLMIRDFASVSRSYSSSKVNYLRPTKKINFSSSRTLTYRTKACSAPLVIFEISFNFFRLRSVKAKIKGESSSSNR